MDDGRPTAPEQHRKEADVASQAALDAETLLRETVGRSAHRSSGTALYPTDLSANLPWSGHPPEVAFVTMGLEYLDLILAPDELALYRVIIRDNVRFPHLGERYRTEALLPRENVVVAYLTRWAPRRDWCIREPSRAVGTFFSLLRRDLFESMLLGAPHPAATDVRRHVERAASDMLTLIERSAFAGVKAIT